MNPLLLARYAGLTSFWVSPLALSGLLVTDKEWWPPSTISSHRYARNGQDARGDLEVSGNIGIADTPILSP